MNFQSLLLPMLVISLIVTTFQINQAVIIYPDKEFYNKKSRLDAFTL